MNLTAPWQRLNATRQDKYFIWTLAILLLLLGYLVGYWTSETRKAIPIVFQGINGDAAKPQILSEADINALTLAAKATPVASFAPQVAGETTTGNSRYVASLNGTKYYLTSCSEVKRIKEENMVFFKTEQEAIEAGYEPAACLTKK